MSFLPKKNYFYGISLAIILGISIHFLSEQLNVINGIISGFLIGIIIGNLFNIPLKFNDGLSYTGSKMLEFSILFLAFSINFNHVLDIGPINFFAVLIIIVLVLFSTLFLAKKFSCPNSTGWLVGFGTAICGSSAIAAVAPSITKNKEDVGVALSVVNLMGSIGMLLLPFIISLVNISDIDSGVIIGATLHSVGNVAGAGYGINDTVGEAAIAIKLARVALLSPAVIFFTFMVQSGEKKTLKSYFKLPYYLWGFILITLLVSMVDMPKVVLGIMSMWGKIVLTIAMVAIGLKVSFKDLIAKGKKAIGFGVVIFVIQLVVAIVFIFGLKLI
jgi:uncharacterized integral membrane protein (TIGR00698 family)